MIALIKREEYDEALKCNRYGARYYYAPMDYDNYHYSDDKEECEGSCTVLTVPRQLFNLIRVKIKEKRHKQKPFDIVKKILKICASYYDIKNNNTNKKIDLPYDAFEERELSTHNTNYYQVTDFKIIYKHRHFTWFKIIKKLF